ncbi:Cof-type HAD-IIB family hydrolase [Macrococcus sp. EM39E]|uniref:Cof-type HAD-IIB family hydrolase n=1 Tax=Macrococcus animalis TaxID=3395467 RepID=UPI0039BE4A11
MNEIKLIALDCDGTLIADNRTITLGTKEALMKAQDVGIKVALVSGRPRTGFKFEIEELDLQHHHGLIGAYNGGMVIDIETDEVLYKQSIAQSDAKEFLRKIAHLNLIHIVDNGTDLYANDADNQYVIHEYRDHGLNFNLTHDLHDTLDFDPMKILLTADPKRIDEVNEEILSICGSQFGAIRSTPFYLEITAFGVNKSSALDHICKSAGIEKENVIAFGDQLNDMEMIRDAGIGVAMGNAHPDLKQIADIVTDDNNSDGIAKVLEGIFQ